jgi:hypothetical protein
MLKPKREARKKVKIGAGVKRDGVLLLFFTYHLPMRDSLDRSGFVV